MPDLRETIAQVRESVVAIMRIREVRRTVTSEPGKSEDQVVDYSVSFGSGFCVLDDRYVITAFHVLNDGNPPEPQDKHFVFTVPANDNPAYHFPVVGTPILHSELDIAVLEIGPCPQTGVHIRALQLSFEPFEDGQRVLTIGFPAPEIHGLTMDARGDFVAGQFFLKSHANEGIIGAHYFLGDLPVYELSVGWHYGESGGPIVALGDSPAAFSLMQQYRNVQTPHGIVPGPRRGVSLARVREDLARLGVTAVSLADEVSRPPAAQSPSRP